VTLESIFIDTSYVVALINERDQYHQEATNLADFYDGHSFMISEPVLLEVGNALCGGYKVEASQVISYFIEADDVEVIRLTGDLFQRGFDLYRKYQDKDWGLVDCISFVIMKDHYVNKALTFDRHFSQAGFTIAG
jgi:predicted nucleic acid-binding protein